MKIGVDVRSLGEPLSGIGRYTLCLLEEMTINRSHEWVFYSQKPLIHGEWDKKNIKIRTMASFIRFKGLYFIWLQLILPFWFKQDEIDLFWSPSHRLPKFMPRSILKVITIHDLVWRYFPETMRPFGKILDSKIMPYSIRVADKIIASSKSTANQIIIEDSKASKKISVVYLGSSINKKTKKLEFKLAKENYILFVGTFEPRKNLKRLLEAYSLLSNSIKDKYPLILVGGSGWGNENINLMIDQLKISNFVKVLGYVSNQDLEKIYSKAYLFVMPSLYEGFGLPVLEAMSFGVPVVTSKASSLPEITGDSAILVNPKSTESIKNGILEVLNDENLRDSLSKAALEKSKFFSWSKSSSQTIKIFEKAFSERLDLKL